jgi:O-antigen ligase
MIMAHSQTADESRRIIFLSAVAFFGLCFLGGGGSRADILSLAYVRFAALTLLAICFAFSAASDWNRLRLPLILMGALAGWTALQLIPLPPALWHGLPGHEVVRQVSEASGTITSWRPISISPDETISSLLAFLPPIAVLVAASAFRRDRRHAITMVIIAGMLASAVVGIAQLIGAVPPLYRVSNAGAPIGFFANRNHQALFLSCSIVLIAYWALQARSDKALQGRALGLVGYALFMIAIILAAGSRAGVVLAMVASGISAAMLRSRMLAVLSRLPRRNRVQLIVLISAVPVLVLLLGAIALSSARAEALQRLFTTGESELRFALMPATFALAARYFPFGAGMGTFDAAYRQVEADTDLNLKYLNHAHNDVVELALTGGLPALIFGVLLVLVAARQAWRVWTADHTHSGVDHARAYSGVLLLTLLSSLVDYPLRTPTIACLCAFGLAVLLLDGSRRSARAEPDFTSADVEGMPLPNHPKLRGFA